MDRRIIVVLLGALVIASGAGYLVYRLVPGNQAAKSPATQIVVAVRDLEIGTLVHENDLKMADWSGAPPKGATSKKAAILNRGVVSEIYQGEPITDARLATAGSGGGLASTIPSGMRACAVRVNEVVGVAGFVIPGMRVDVLITGVPPGQSGTAGPAVKTLLQNIQVLSAGPNIDQDKEGKPQQVQVVNLLVNPGQAELLSLAGNETRIQLILRNPLDTEITTPPGKVMSELFGEERIRPVIRAAAAKQMPAIPILIPGSRPQSPAAPVFETVEVLNGAVRSQAKFPGAGVRR
jgi:pilus assembly protein CpaB